MARVNKNEKKKTKVTQTATKKSSSIAVSEETAKGELFFKVILGVMLIAILAVVVYFVVDTLIKQSDDSSTKYTTNNYLDMDSLTELMNLIQDDSTSLDSIGHEGLRHALDHFDSVYVYFFAEDKSILSDSGRQRQELVDDVMDDIVDLSGAVETDISRTDDEYLLLIINGETAIFFFDTSDILNEGWQSLIPSDAFSGATVVPILLEVRNGSEDVDWFPAAGGTTAFIKSQQLLESLS